MFEIQSLTYEEARAEHFKELMKKMQRKIDWWQYRGQYSLKPGGELSRSHLECSEAGIQYSYYNDALKALENQPKWISVEERLPEELGVVLGVMIGTVTLLFYVGDGEFRTGNGMLWKKGCGYITHWMPLPESPKEDV